VKEEKEGEKEDTYVGQSLAATSNLLRRARLATGKGREEESVTGKTERGRRKWKAPS
jgi:hypothetical protein